METSSSTRFLTEIKNSGGNLLMLNCLYRAEGEKDSNLHTHSSGMKESLPSWSHFSCLIPNYHLVSLSLPFAPSLVFSLFLIGDSSHLDPLAYEGIRETEHKRKQTSPISIKSTSESSHTLQHFLCYRKYGVRMSQSERMSGDECKEKC